ncbi:MAG: TetR/AcrR family transcriptional regulator [Rhodothermaceae bacterium]
MPRTKEQFAEMREKTKELITRASMKLFAENSYHGTSITQIAKEAGISKGLIYNYFDKKEEIVEVIIKEAFGEFEKMFAEQMKMEDPFEALGLIIESSFKMVKSQTEFYKLFIMISLQKDLQEITMRIMTDFYGNVYSYFEELFKRIGVENYVLEARIFGATFDGVFLNYSFFSQEFPIDDIKNYLLKKYDVYKK